MGKSTGSPKRGPYSADGVGRGQVTKSTHGVTAGGYEPVKLEIGRANEQ